MDRPARDRHDIRMIRSKYDGGGMMQRFTVVGELRSAR